MLKENQYYLIKQTLAIIFLSAIIIFISKSSDIFHGKLVLIRIFLLLLIFVFFLKIFFYFRVNQRIKKGEHMQAEENHNETTLTENKRPVPENKVFNEKENIEKNNFFSIPNNLEKKYWTAYEKTLSLVVYGDLQKAENNLNSLDWEHAPVEISAMRLAVLSWIKILKREVSDGMNLIQKADEAALTGDFSRNQKTDKAAIIIAKILNGITANNPNTKLMARLEEKMESFMPFERVLGAWTLANGYKKTGNQGKAELYLSFCRRRAPFCKYLHTYIN